MKTKNNATQSNLLTKIVVMMMVVMVLLSAISPMKASAHSAYFLSITLNTADARYEPLILFDRNSWTQIHESHRESKIDYFGAYKYGTDALPAMKKNEATSVEDALKKYKGKPYTRSGVGDPFLIYTFPGLHEKGSMDGSAKDMQRAEWISRTVVQGLNDAIAFVAKETGKKPEKTALMYLGTNLANGGYKKATFTYAGQKVTITPSVKLPSGEPKVSGINSDGYAKITVNGQTRYFVTKAPKGYRDGQPLRKEIPSKERKKYDADVKSISWRHVVLQAHYSYGQNDVSYDSIDSIVKPGKMEEAVTEVAENFILMLRSMLGLYSFSELMLNDGSRGGSAYFLGIMPMSWLDSASVLHWTSMALSWLLIMFAFARLLAMRNLASINIAKRVDLVDGIKNLIVVGFALMLFNPIFYALANFNYLLVDVMQHTSSVTNQFGASSPDTNVLAKVLINFIYLVIEVYFNFIYISRGIVVAILFGTGPLFIASLAFGGKYVQIFSNYMKELVGTIYVQTFHAILVAFFATVTIFGGVRVFEQIVVLCAFIPLTKFFREAIGLGGGVMDVAGGGAFGLMADATKVGTKSARSGGRNLAGKAKTAYQSRKGGGGAPMTQMKSSTQFQNGGSGSGGSTGSMAKVDNSTVNTGGAGGTGGAQGSAGGAGSAGSAGSAGGSGGTNLQGRNPGGSGGANGAGGSMTNVGSKASHIAGQAVKGAVNGATTTAGLGMAMGLRAVGEGSVGQTLAQTTPNKSRAFNSTKSMQDVKKKKQKAPQDVFENSAYQNSSISDDGKTVTHNFRKNNADGSDGMYDEYGITDVRDNGGSVTYEYDYNANSHQFNSGTHNEGEKAIVMQDMYKAFNTENPTAQQQARKAEYEKQGIQSVSKNESGRIEITASKGTGGIQGVSTGNGMYSFRKRNGDNGSVNLLDSVEAPKHPNGENQG